MKKILVLLALMMAILLVGCGGSSSGSDIKDALNNTSTFSQEDINYVNNYIEEMKKYGIAITSKTVNSSTMQISGTYTYEDEDTGNDVTGSFSTKLEKKNGLVYETFTDYLDPDDSYVNFELTIPRLFGTFTNIEYFSKEQSEGFSKLLSDNGLSGFNTWYTNLKKDGPDGLAIHLNISLGSWPNYIYEGTIGKYNNKYHLFDETGIIASENTLEALISNTSVKAKLQAQLDKK